MKTLKIGGKDYKIEYSIEASLYPACTETIMDTFINMGVGNGAAENNDPMTVIDTIKKTVSNIPTKALVLFHAGLLENHGLSENESKELLKEYLRESKKTFRDVLEELMGVVNEDNFFDLVGLNQIFPAEETENQPKKQKTKGGENTSTNA